MSNTVIEKSATAPAGLGATPPLATVSPLNIVHVVRQFHPSTGGLEDFVDHLTREQVAAGHKVRIITCNQVFATLEDLPASAYDDGRQIIRVPFRGPSKYPIAPDVLRHFEGADLVHVHAIDFFFDFLSATRFIHRKPLVATTHGGFFHTQDMATIKKIWFQTLTRISALGYGRIIGCSQNDTRNFQAIAGQRVQTIDNGVDIAKFADCASRKAVPNIVTLGRFSKNKRLDRMIAVMAHLPSRWTLDIIGAESDWSAADLHEMIADADVADRVRVHVRPSNEAIADLMGGASLFASASEFEGFGLAVVEAMSAGLVPVLEANSTFVDLAGRHDLVTLTQFENPALAAEQFKETFEKIEQSKVSMRQQAMDRAQLYAWPQVAARYEDAYAAVLADR
ncbi:MAG: glycosyltransferase family 4 protein [Pseudomonadota bacterium]